MPKTNGRTYALAFLFILGAYVRFDEMALHFAHVDDLGVATTILNIRSRVARWDGERCEFVKGRMMVRAE